MFPQDKHLIDYIKMTFWNIKVNKLQKLNYISEYLTYSVLMGVENDELNLSFTQWLFSPGIMAAVGGIFSSRANAKS